MSDYLSRVAALGCVICGAPAEIHHLREGVGMAQRSPDSRAIPLCPAHHRTGGHGVAYHAGRLTWVQRYGEPEALLERVRRQLEHAEAA
jgi:hypothetical protein